MEILKKIYKYILSRFTKVQLAVILVILVCAFIISDSNIFTRINYDLEIHDLKGQIEYYREKTEEDKKKIEELNSDKDNIEKFARENYKMKRENEEVFIIEE
ncbi:MAG: septum formation initiator family protein [Dysgonomonas sp.]|nr:septum formation initiator family protein [Dysgonomonas sp.]